MPQTPPMNLSPEATPWGRAMQAKIEELERSAARREQAEANANQGQNATLAAMAKQILTMGETVVRLDGVVADLQEVVNAQVSPKVANGSGSGFYVSPTFATVASAAITVPSGYTRALVFASGQVTGGNNDALDIAKLYAHILINGDAGPDSIVSMVNVGWNTATAFASENLTGLSGGSISIAIAAKTSGGTTSSTTAPWDNSTLTVQAIFLR